MIVRFTIALSDAERFENGQYVKSLPFKGIFTVETMQIEADSSEVEFKEKGDLDVEHDDHMAVRRIQKKNTSENTSKKGQEFLRGVGGVTSF